MVNYCIDTNIAIDVFRGDETLKDKVLKVVSSRGKIFLSSIGLCELFKGVYVLKFKNEQDAALLKIKDFVGSFELVGLNEVSCEEFGKIYGILKKSGKIVPESDLMIASICKVNDLVLITRDKKHFKNLGIKVEVW